MTSRRADRLPGWLAHGQPTSGISRPHGLALGAPWWRPLAGEKTAGRKDASASDSLLSRKYFQARPTSKMRPGVRLVTPWFGQPELASLFLCHSASRAQYLAGLSMKDTSENTDQIEETEDTSTVSNATTDEGHDDVPARVRLSPIAYEIIRAGSKAYTLLIEKQPVANMVTKKDAETVEALFRFLTKYSGRRYMRAALESVLTEPDTNGEDSAGEETGSEPENN